ncbi:MAG: glycoside hydrolase family 127 protein [Candidatus Sumerlaeota bacterium]|nr:glycoside hydrolase family 127 protein [Candidatus Sumerlaeota bacterium]
MAHGFIPRAARWAAMIAGGMTVYLALEAPGQDAGDKKFAVAPKASIKAFPFDLKDVRLLDGPFRDAMLRDKEYLMSLDSDRLLHTFRLNAGLPSSAEPLGGWEDPKGELRGHCMGHYLSACALMHGSTGDEAIKKKADAIVAELAKCQEAAPSKGFSKGYLSAYPESFIDRVETLKPVWAPWYTLHKIHAGLLDMYVLCGNKQALDVANKFADWVKFRMDRLSEEQQQKMLNCEHGGMCESFANQYAITGNPDHLRMARAFTHKAFFDPAAKQEDNLNGKHANTQIPKFIGYSRVYELTGEAPYKTASGFFWENVALRRSYCIGGHSDHEHFFPVDQFSKHLSPETAETCNTYNMLKLTRNIFGWDPSPKTMDFYERALYNHILASQDPKTGMIVYLMSLKPGHFKTYSTPLNSFWCCVGTGIENHAKYNDTIYYHSGDALWLNLFIASELNWKEKGLTLRQETRFPEEDTTRLTFKCPKPVALTLNVRCPYWAQSGMTVAINGEKQSSEAKAGSYAAIKREWKDGDKVEVRLPMSLRAEALPDDPRTVAVMFGPIALAGEMGREGLDKIDEYQKNQTALSKVPSPDAPMFLCEAKDLISKIEPVAGKPLAFRTKGIGKPSDVSLIPFYQMHHQRYSVYWKFTTEEELKKRAVERAAAEQKRKAFEARITDEVRPSEQQSETDHKLQSDKSNSGDFHARKWRDARAGWFSYEVKVAPDQPMQLMVAYWGDDTNGREFDVLIDGEKIASQTLNKNKPGEFFDQPYDIPEKLTKGKERVTVKFAAHPGKTAGGVFGILALKNTPSAK